MLYEEELYLLYNSILINTTIAFIAANHFRVSNYIYGNNMSKTILNSYKNKKNKQVTISEIVPEQQQQEKEYIILKIYKSEIDKAIENLKRLGKINQYYEPDYKLIVERSTNTILDDCGGYEILKQAIISTDQTAILERDEL
jgi:uncharacterized membrane protein